MGFTFEIVRRLKEIMGDFYNPVMVIFKILFIILITAIVIRVGSFVIKKLFKKRKMARFDLDEKKINTMGTLAVSIFRYSTYILAGVVILTDVFNLTSVLAAAGVGGVAVGLGAQSLIKDVISGFFIVVEDQYSVGDMITIDDMSGIVENLELRVTKIRNMNGDLYIIPNGEIKKITNHTRGNKAVIVDIPIAYSSDIAKAIEIADAVCEKASKEFDVFVEAPRVLGVTELGKDSLNLRIFGKTLPMQQWGAEREIRKLIKEEFDREHIKFYDRNRIIGEESRS